jgi:chemotaxis protein MotB
MRFCILFILIVFISSCVSSKKYTELENQLSHLQENILLAQTNLAKSQAYTNTLNVQKDSLYGVLNYQISQINEFQNANNMKTYKLLALESDVSKLSLENKNLNQRIDNLTLTSKVNAEIMKKTIEELNTQQLKVLNLSLALQKYDTLQISAVKNPTRKLSDEKLKKSLEKVGFVFY